MKILLVSSYLPYPLDSGGQVRLYNILKQLSLHHEITLICEKRPRQTEKDIQEVVPFCQKVITVDRKKQWSPSTILKTGFSSYPFLLTGHTLPEMKAKIKEELKNDYDLIHVETFYVAQNLPETTLPVVLVEHNIEYQVYERYKKQLSGGLLLLAPLLSVDIAKIRRWEEYFWKEADCVVAVSEQEKEVIQKVQQSVAIVPNGVDLKTFQPTKKEPEEKRILFIGDFSWLQNRDTAEWILKEIWPSFTNASEGKPFHYTLWIVGRKIPEYIKELGKGDKSVIIDENSPLTTPEIFQKATALLSPIRVGGGTSYKILEAMASGTVVITTTLGNEGINATVDKELLVGNTAAELVSVLKKLDNKDHVMQMRKTARQFVEKNYSWDTIVEKLEKVYAEVVRK